jgi:hypothetical protein
MRSVRDGIVAGMVAGVLSGAPSTVHALVTRSGPLAAAEAAGAVLLPAEHRRARLLAAAVPVHFGISLGWGMVLARLLPRRSTVLAGTVAGALIAAGSLRLPGRRTARVRELPLLPQLADHLAYGAVVGYVLRQRDSHLP